MTIDIITYLPTPSFAESAKMLDNRRLAQQRIEANTILHTLSVDDDDRETWLAEHPGVLMWRGFAPALLAYLVCICDEWVARGNRDSVKQMAIKTVARRLGVEDDEAVEAQAHQDVLELFGMMPPWLGREDIHASHRSYLLRLDPMWYSQWQWQEAPATDEDERAVVWPEPLPLPAEGDKQEDTDPEDTPEDQEPQAEPTGGSSMPPRGATKEAPAPKGAGKAAASNGSNEGELTRAAVLAELEDRGYEGPTSYTKGKLLEILDDVRAGRTPDLPTRGRPSGEGAEKPKAAARGRKTKEDG